MLDGMIPPGAAHPSTDLLTTAAAVHRTAAAVLRVGRAGRLVRSAALVALACLVGATVVGTAPARAHTGGDPAVTLTVDALPEALDGVVLQVQDRLAAQLVLANPTDRVVEVVGVEGRPFLRIGPDGVEANLAVAEWYTTNDPFGGTELPEAVGGDDRWALVAEEPSWGWFDHRLHPRPWVVPDEIAAIGRPADFDRWSVDLRVDGDPVTVEGAVRYQPLRGTHVTAVEAAPDADLDLTVLPGPIPGLFLDVRDDREVVVLGAEDEPFLRVADGGVQANVRSPAWLASARASEGTTPTAVVDPTADPEWVDVADVPRYGWVDPRLAAPDREPPESVIDTAQPAEVARWEVGLLVDGQPTLVAGSVTWQPDPDLEPRTAAGTGRWWAVAVVAALAVAGVGLTRMRSRRSRPAGG